MDVPPINRKPASTPIAPHDKNTAENAHSVKVSPATVDRLVTDRTQKIDQDIAAAERTGTSAVPHPDDDLAIRENKIESAVVGNLLERASDAQEQREENWEEHQLVLEQQRADAEARTAEDIARTARSIADSEIARLNAESEK